jgi:hypothetical protein
MDRNWEREQIEKLVKKQKLKIAELEKENLKKIEEEQKLIESKKKENQQNSLNKE